MISLGKSSDFRVRVVGFLGPGQLKGAGRAKDSFRKAADALSHGAGQREVQTKLKLKHINTDWSKLRRRGDQFSAVGTAHESRRRVLLGASRGGGKKYIGHQRERKGCATTSTTGPEAGGNDEGGGPLAWVKNGG